MPADNRDICIIEKMKKYCDEIEEAHNKFGMSHELFLTDAVYRNAVSLCIMQIGELSNHLSEDFKKDHSYIPWKEIRGMRNVVAHEYGSIDAEIVWETATESISEIKKFCQDILEKNQL